MEVVNLEAMVTDLRVPITEGVADHTTADTIIKVPQMAESITEGTLKQFSKRMFLT